MLTIVEQIIVWLITIASINYVMPLEQNDLLYSELDEIEFLNPSTTQCQICPSDGPKDSSLATGSSDGPRVTISFC